MKKILITGYKGYVGSNLCKLLSKNKSLYLIGLDKNLFTKNEELNDIVDKNYDLDIKDINKVKEKDIDTIIHLAAISNDPMGDKFKKLTYKTNLYDSKKVFEFGKKNGIKKFIFSSSCSVYGLSDIRKKKGNKENDKTNPLTNYAKTKVKFEEFLKKNQSKVNVYILRFATASGISLNFRNDLAINNLTYFGVKLENIKVLSNGKPMRPFIDCMDMCRAIEFFINKKINKKKYDIFNVGSNKNNISIKNLAKLISKKIKCRFSINSKATNDSRSYIVNFNKFETETKFLNRKFSSINKIITNLEIFFKNKKFINKKSFYRLNYLSNGIKKNSF